MTTTLTPAETAYQDLAPWYDRLTADHDYDRWLTTLLGLAERSGLSGTEVLDVACGTGKSFLPLLARGYDVVACDLVLCLGDSVNYVLEPGEVDAAFASAARNLRPGGIYLFDVNNLEMYRT